MADRLGWDQPGPIIIEEPIEDGEFLRNLLTRLARRITNFSEAIFDPATQSFSSEVSVVIIDNVQKVSQNREPILQDGDRILFLPILGGG
jgi:molybdopterin converting factor small subunit